MMKLVRITKSDDNYLERLVPLYKEAFPVEERRDIEQLKHLIDKQPEMYFNAIECDGQLAGFFVYWNLKDFYYLEHLAVFSEMRNLKVGQQVLDYIAEHLTGLRLLEVEPTTDEITTRRVNYYKRNGYIVLDTEYIQPSYREDRVEGNLWIMGNKQTDRLQEFIERIKREVYRSNYNN